MVCDSEEDVDTAVMIRPHKNSENPMPSIRNIVFPTDFSPHSEAAIEIAVAFAKLDGATVHLLHALHSPKDLRMSAGWWGMLRGAAIKGLNEFSDRFEAAGVSVETHIVDEEPTTATLDLAEKMNAELIVMGSMGRTELSHVLLGSVAERTIALAKCPVLTVRASD